MNALSLTAVEEALLPFRIARRRVLDYLLPFLFQGNVVADPFVLFTRFFVRLKSGDSILEKVTRKGIILSDVTEIPEKITDVLGFRIIATDHSELTALDNLLTTIFEVISRNDSISQPDEFGRREINYELLHRDGNGGGYRFELQLRTFLQHYWTSRSFHLFHKQPRETAHRYADALKDLGETLERAEHIASHLPASSGSIVGPTEAFVAMSKLRDRVNLIVIEPGERFAIHIALPLSGDDHRDHEIIVNRKLELYTTFPGSALVECSCLNFLSFALNEPHVQIPLDRLDNAIT